jgi:hypothetical protein
MTMKKTGMTFLFLPLRGMRRCVMSLAAVALAAGISLAPARAYAQCENPFNATNQFNQMAKDIVKELNDFIQQEENFIDEKLTHTATYEMELRLYEFDTNTRKALTDWWNARFLPDLRKMTQQLSAARLDQTKALGQMMDAENLNETMHDYQRREAEAFHRYQPSEMACTLDTQGPGTGKAYRISRAFAAGAVKDSTDARLLKKGTPGAKGIGALQNWKWNEYISKYCDPELNDQGCTTAPDPDLAGRNRDLPGMLWGVHETVDMKLPENRNAFNAVMDYFVGPAAMDPIPPSVLKGTNGRQAMLSRRADTARINTIYNTIAQMMSERVGGSEVDVQSLREQGGLPPGDASTDASYREIQQAMTKDRFRSDNYITSLVNNPASLVRTEGAINAIKMQQMNDIYHRIEERVFMEAATYSKVLDDHPVDTANEASQVH